MIRLPTRVARTSFDNLASSEKVIQLLLPTYLHRSHAFGKLRMQWAGFAPATPGRCSPRPVLCLFVVLCGKVLRLSYLCRSDDEVFSSMATLLLPAFRLSAYMDCHALKEQGWICATISGFPGMMKVSLPARMRER